MKNKLKFDKSMSVLVRERQSVRTYDAEKEIATEIVDALNNYIAALQGPFKPTVRFKVIKTKENTTGKNLGTYGVIKGVDTYIGAVVEKGPMAMENLGYEMEELILYATSLGLGTCWLGGTFNKSGFAKAMEVKENEIFTIISPIGYKSEEIRFVDKIFRKGKGDRRKEWVELFYLKDFFTPLDKDADIGIMKDVFENVRLAPSAMNKQPWRVVLDGKQVHFFKVGKQSQAAKDAHLDLSDIDMGIALAHFDLSCKEKGVEGSFGKELLKIHGVPKNVEYLITWTRK